MVIVGKGAVCRSFTSKPPAKGAFSMACCPPAPRFLYAVVLRGLPRFFAGAAAVSTADALLAFAGFLWIKLRRVFFSVSLTSAFFVFSALAFAAAADVLTVRLDGFFSSEPETFEAFALVAVSAFDVFRVCFVAFVAFRVAFPEDAGAGFLSRETNSTSVTPNISAMLRSCFRVGLNFLFPFSHLERMGSLTPMRFAKVD